MFIRESYYENELEAQAEKVLKNYAVGKLLIAGDNRFLSADLISFLYYLVQPYASVSEKAYRLQVSLLNSVLKDSEIYAPGAAYDSQERYTLLRNPHIARNEEVLAVPAEEAEHNLRDLYLSHLTDVVMVSPTALIAERLGGADYDGDMIKTIAEPILNDCVMQNYAGADYAISHQTSLPLLQIPSADPLIHNTLDLRRSIIHFLPASVRSPMRHLTAVSLPTMRISTPRPRRNADRKQKRLPSSRDLRSTPQKAASSPICLNISAKRR